MFIAISTCRRQLIVFDAEVSKDKCDSTNGNVPETLCKTRSHSDLRGRREPEIPGLYRASGKYPHSQSASKQWLHSQRLRCGSLALNKHLKYRSVPLDLD